MTELRNPRAEAQRLVGNRFDARVLEPSAPAEIDAPFFADDPVSLEWVREGAEAIVPAGMPGGIDWNEWLENNQSHGAWVAERWLGGGRRLPPIPDSLSATRTSLHKLAMFVIAPVRFRENGKFGLRYTAGGFGTPFFGDDRQVRVAGLDLFDQDGDRARSTRITTLAAAAEFFDAEIDTETATEHDSPPIGDPNEVLDIDLAASEFLGAWYGMAFAALELVRSDDASVDPSRPQIWPGHFDPAIEVGDEDHRGSYGASPGDHSIDEPYLYVSLWWPDKIGIDASADVWNAPSFTGSVLKLSDFDPDRDPVETAAEFWRSVRDRL